MFWRCAAALWARLPWLLFMSSWELAVCIPSFLDPPLSCCLTKELKSNPWEGRSPPLRARLGARGGLLMWVFWSLTLWFSSSSYSISYRCSSLSWITRSFIPNVLRPYVIKLKLLLKSTSARLTFFFWPRF